MGCLDKEDVGELSCIFGELLIEVYMIGMMVRRVNDVGCLWMLWFWLMWVLSSFRVCYDLWVMVMLEMGLRSDGGGDLMRDWREGFEILRGGGGLWGRRGVGSFLECWIGSSCFRILRCCLICSRSGWCCGLVWWLLIKCYKVLWRRSIYWRCYYLIFWRRMGVYWWVRMMFLWEL